MIVVETFLRDLFSQIPPISYTDVNKGASTIDVKYHWGGQDDLNLYLKQEAGNKTPLIWLVQDRGRQVSTELKRRVKLIIAKDSEHKTSMNPKVWDTEFAEFLNPLLDKVVQCLMKSGMTIILNDTYDVYREANYSEYEREISSKRETQNKVIDHWNVITFEADILFTGDNTQCINTIYFDND